MGELVVVAGKVPRELRDKAKKYGINISRVIREALEKAVREREERIFRDSVKKCAKILSKVDIERIVKSIREDRDRG